MTVQDYSSIVTYDFNVRSQERRVEKIRYIYRNPVYAAW